MSTKQTEAQRLAGTLMRDVGSQLANRKQAAALLRRQDELLEQALEALEMLTDNYDDDAVGSEIDAIIAIRAHREAK